MLEKKEVDLDRLVDPEILSSIKKLRAKGVETTSSCSGHPNGRGGNRIPYLMWRHTDAGVQCLSVAKKLLEDNKVFEGEAHVEILTPEEYGGWGMISLIVHPKVRNRQVGKKIHTEWVEFLEILALTFSAQD